MADMTQAEFNAMLQIALAQGLPGGIYTSKFGRGEDIDAALDGGALFATPEAHRNIFRGRFLGTVVTAAQRAAIQDGSFKDLFIGDYWIINNVTWRIADINYFFNIGDTNFTKPHLVIVPDTTLYNAQMNDSSTTTGGYIGSMMYKNHLNSAKSMVTAAFGNLVLNHRDYLTNAVTDGHPSGNAWYDSTVELMDEIMVYGCNVFAPMTTGAFTTSKFTTGKLQFALFALNPKMVNTRDYYWLRDIVSNALFALVNNVGLATNANASNNRGVRPYFIIG